MINLNGILLRRALLLLGNLISALTNLVVFSVDLLSSQASPNSPSKTKTKVVSPIEMKRKG
jgi:hypothetical protein